MTAGIIPRVFDIFQQLAHGVIVHDAAGAVMFVNPAAERMLGVTGADLRGATAPGWDAVREDGSPCDPASHPWMVALRSGQPVTDVVIGVVHPAGGRRRWISVSAVPRFEAGGYAPSDVITTFSDITAIKEAEESLRRREERFRIAAECASDVLFEWDLATGRVEHFGRSEVLAKESRLGTAAEWIERLHPEERIDATPLVAASAADPPRGGSESVLVVEDERALRVLITTVLTRRGYTVETCTDAGEAIEWIRQHQGALDLVITDLVMPTGNGKQVADFVQRHRPDTRVLLMSGYADHVAFDVAGLAADALFLQKPFTPADLARRVRDVLDRKA